MLCYTYMRASELWHMATLAYGHTHIVINFPWERMHEHYAANSTTDNANFINFDYFLFMCDADVPTSASIQHLEMSVGASNIYCLITNIDSQV